MNDKDKPGQDEGIKVTNHRRFTPEGEPRAAEGEGASTQEPSAPEPKAPREGEGGPAEKGEKRPLSEIDFPTFILSLATSARVHLGLVPNPASGKQEQDLDAAKQTIDILGMMKEKTKGNLTSEEDRLLEHVLYDLMMMYVEINRGQK